MLPVEAPICLLFSNPGNATNKPDDLTERGQLQTMNASSIGNTDVLITGAGPTGLVLGLWLTRLGVRVRIIDKAAEPGTTSRAIAVQARTLELYRQIGLADVLVERGWKTIIVNLWVAGKNAARAIFG